MSVSTIDLCQSAVTHIGLVRSINQDNYSCNPAAGVWVVADGMGGHHGGERASALIVERIDDLPEISDFVHRVAAVRGAIAQANREIFNEARIKSQQMGSTVVALVIGEARYAILWVGDSRAYLKRDDVFFCLTRDHSQAEELIKAGLLDPHSAADHPSSHILSRAVGVLPNVDIEEVTGECAENDIFLLCSDGLYSLVNEAEMAKMINEEPFARVGEQLVELGLERGAPDNITICLASAVSNRLFTGL